MHSRAFNAHRKMTSASFNTVLANKSESAQSFSAKSNILIEDNTKSFDFDGFPDQSPFLLTTVWPWPEQNFQTPVK